MYTGGRCSVIAATTSEAAKHTAVATERNPPTNNTAILEGDAPSVLQQLAKPSELGGCDAFDRLRPEERNPPENDIYILWVKPKDISMADLPERKHPAHQVVFEHGNRSSILFVTICTAKRKPLLAHEDIHERLTQAWLAADHWIVGRYVIMPDHIHLFCAPRIHDHLSIQQWVHFWKSHASKNWPRRSEHPIWQADIWDRQLRSGESYSEKWAYALRNPVRHGLVEKVEDWPHQGELNQLSWHD